MSTHPCWRLVVPVKRAREAKSRLRPPHGVRRADLAHAMAHDTLAAACAGLGPHRVVVVTSDASTSETVRRLGAHRVPDPGTGLDAAVAAGLERCRREEPGGHVAVLLGDLPALRPADLLTALQECARHTRTVVPDHTGTGTVLLATTGPDLRPAFGSGSAARHAAGATRLELDLPRLRQDVDDRDDLLRAVGLGVGPATRAVLADADHA
ncbi:2-phospho-L-lactate guanylyltransferase [Ornithinimicrobium sediminis]|uniref:2-phospho-L-lactate guanylyltransferase n=1 Tax=Ornithinimicrobium sediminis TaxID=2904603 RepID=UPI001E592F64|nr:2-phospho-L-lactate guanylyltransferase [Ornithinimicrobium sediminis]